MIPTKHILLIEDDETLGAALMKKLIEGGYAATWEKNGTDGLRRFKLLQPHLLLLDLSLPGLSGEDILDVAGKDEDLSRIPVIVISNSGLQSDIDRLRGMGAKDYLVKADFHPTDIVSRVGKVLSPEVQEKERKQRYTIFIVEDDQILGSLAVTKFTKAGYDVIRASDGKECLALLSSGKTPDLILLDIIMPEVNGFDVLRAMKRESKLMNIPVVIFSNYAQDQDLDTARSLGAVDFLVKSKMTLKEVVDRVGEILHG
jgi:DNA-binding response OmpR family regulator